MWPLTALILAIIFVPAFLLTGGWAFVVTLAAWLALEGLMRWSRAL